MLKNIPLFRVNNSRILMIKNAKFKRDFQIFISIPLMADDFNQR